MASLGWFDRNKRHTIRETLHFSLIEERLKFKISISKNTAALNLHKANASRKRFGEGRLTVALSNGDLVLVVMVVAADGSVRR